MTVIAAPRLGWLVSALLLYTQAAHAQSKHVCLSFLHTDAHDRFECVEALLSEPKWHFTYSGLPPGNGFALGGIFERETLYVSPFNPLPPPLAHPGPFVSDRLDSAPQGKLSSTDVKFALVGSINQSWLATGSFILIPPAYHQNTKPAPDGYIPDCQRLAFLCTQTQLALHFQANYRSLQTVSFYGLGPRSPALKHTFHQDDAYGTASARLPLKEGTSETEDIVAEAGIEILKPRLPVLADPLSVSANFNNLTAPGLQSQPTFVHPHLALLTSPVFLSNPITNDSDTNTQGPLLKRNIRFTLNNNAEYHWYAAVNSSGNSFQQLVFNGDETIELGSNIRRLVYQSDDKGFIRHIRYGILQEACGNGDAKAKNPPPDAQIIILKVHSQCDYGRLDFRSHLAASYTGSGSTIPFYLQPTVGGSDINSQVSLRAFPNYRFRDRDAVFVQTEYSVPIYDPFGLLLFYDAGNVGPTVSSLSFAHLRQDAGAGATFRLQGNVLAQAYLAWGAGHGPTLNYNITLSF